MEDLRPKNIQTAGQFIEAIQKLWEARSLKNVRSYLQQLETEEEYDRLIRLADQADLFAYSNFLATQASKRFGTVRSFAWHCERIADIGRPLQAEEMIQHKLQEHELEQLPSKARIAVHRLLLRLYCQLNRLPEAEKQVKLLKEAGDLRIVEQEAYYHIHSGEWEKAEQLLNMAIIEAKEKAAYQALLLYAHLLSMMGKVEESLSILRKGQKLYPEIPAFRLEQIYRLRILEEYEQTVDLMKAINEEIPFHSLKDLHTHLTALCLYRLERWDELKEWVQSNEAVLKDSVYGKADIEQAGTHRQLPLTPTVQKMNYCVPASLSMMLQINGMEKDQDEIAAHIFDVTGSKLRTTITYMESLGLTARCFKGSVEVFKQFIDEGIPVLLSMMVENNSHVQVVTGYDDRLQALTIQDPNDLEPFLLSYGSVASAYKMTELLSLVFVRDEQKPLLDQLDSREHRFFIELFNFLDEEEESEAFIAFLDAHKESQYLAVTGLAAFYSEKAKAFHEGWLRLLTEAFGEKDAELSLLAANMHYQKNEYSEALSHLSNVQETKSPYAHFLKGIICLQQDRPAKAVPFLKRSLELDPYQPVAYSYLSRAYMDMGEIRQAYKWAEIALEQLPSDVFIRITHGLVQYESGAYQKALKVFKALAKEHPDDDYFAYEEGRCLQHLDEAQAFEAFRRSISLKAEEPYPYLRMAEMHMKNKAYQKAQEVLAEGIGRAANLEGLYGTLGELWLEQEEYGRAEAAYRQVLALDPDDLFAVTTLAHCLLSQGRVEEADACIAAADSKADAPFFIRTASMLWETAEDYTGKERALALLEKGLDRAESDELEDLVERYASFGEDALFRSRIIDKLKSLQELHSHSLLPCYEGVLHELYGNTHYARTLYQQAAESGLPFAFFHLGLLDEQEEAYDSALAHYTACLQLNSEFSAALEGQMRVFTLTDKPDKALTAGLRHFAQEPLGTDITEIFDLVRNEEQLHKLEQLLDKLENQLPADWLLTYRALCAEKEGAEEQAKAQFEQAEAIVQAYPVRMQYAAFYMRQGEFKKATAKLEELIADNPLEEGVYELYIEALRGKNKTSEVQKRLKKMVPEEQLGYAEACCADQLVSLLEEMEREEPKNLIAKLKHKSSRLLKISAIISLYESAKKRLPDSDMPILKLALFYFNYDMAEEALEVLDKYLSYFESDEAAHLRLAITMDTATAEESEKLFRSAIKHAQQLHEKTPFDASVLLMHGDALAALGETEQALEQIEHAIHLEPYHAAGYVNAVRLLTTLRPEEALALPIPQELSVHEELQLERSLVYMQVDRPEEAIKGLLSLVENNPRFLPAIYELAGIEMFLGNRKSAKKWLIQLLEQDEEGSYHELIEEEELFEPLRKELSDRFERNL